MRKVTYRWFEDDPKTAESYTVSLVEFVYNVVSITESGIIPPCAILNERFVSGGKCNPFGNVEWAPFEIDQDEYDWLVDELESRDSGEIWSHKGIAFVKLRRAIELDGVTSGRRWSRAVSEKYSDEYIAKLIELNAAEQGRSSLDQKRPGGGEASSEKPDLGTIHQVLLDLSSNAVKRFAAEHEDKRFYAFGFDLNAAYGDVLLCANTEIDFEETSRRYIQKYGYTETELAGLKKNFGDWRYQGFNLDYEGWNERWGPCKAAIESFVHSADCDEEVSNFLTDLIRTCSIVLLELEGRGLLKQLHREPGFYIQCLDHDENEDEAEHRFEKYRREYASIHANT